MSSLENIYLYFLCVDITVGLYFMAPPAEADALSEVIFLLDRIFEGTGPLLGVIKEIKLGPEAKRGGPWLLR